MNDLEIVSAFVDRRSGKTFRPGDPLPKGLDEERVNTLVKAGCLAFTKFKTTPAPGSGPDLFPEETGDETGGDETGASGSDTEAVAGGDGGDTGGRPQPTTRRRRSRKSKSEGDSDQ